MPIFMVERRFAEELESSAEEIDGSNRINDEATYDPGGASSPDDSFVRHNGHEFGYVLSGSQPSEARPRTRRLRPLSSRARRGCFLRSQRTDSRPGTRGSDTT